METGEELTERQRYWLAHLEACEESGETTKSYASLHGLSVSMMYSWRKELTVRGVLRRQANRTRAPGFDRVQVVEPGVSGGVCRVTLPNGVQIEICGVFDGATQTKLFESLMRL